MLRELKVSTFGDSIESHARETNALSISFEHWLDLSYSHSEQDRRAALRYLLGRSRSGARLRRRRAVQNRLLELIEDPSPRVWHTAVLACTKTRIPGSVEKLARILKDEKRPEIRCFAAAAMGFQENPVVIPAIISCAGDASEPTDLRESCVRALGRLGDRESSPFIKRLTFSKQWQIRWAATVALWMLGDSEACQLLQQQCNDRQLPADLRKCAIKLLSAAQRVTTVPK